MKTLICALLAAATLGGCVAVPVYEPAASIYVQPYGSYYRHPYRHHHYRGHYR